MPQTKKRKRRRRRSYLRGGSQTRTKKITQRALGQRQTARKDFFAAKKTKQMEASKELLKRLAAQGKKTTRKRKKPPPVSAALKLHIKAKAASKRAAQAKALAAEKAEVAAAGLAQSRAATKQLAATTAHVLKRRAAAAQATRQKSAATRIQAAQRGRTARTQTTKQKSAATRIQAAQRGRTARAQTTKQKSAATRIQAAQRGRTARAQTTKQKSAATRIQAAQRGHVGRKRGKRKKAAVGRIQAAQRGRIGRQRATRKKAAVGRIQATQRGRVGRKRATRRKAEVTAARRRAKRVTRAPRPASAPTKKKTTQKVPSGKPSNPPAHVSAVLLPCHARGTAPGTPCPVTGRFWTNVGRTEKFRLSLQKTHRLTKKQVDKLFDEMEAGETIILRRNDDDDDRLIRISMSVWIKILAKGPNYTAKGAGTTSDQRWYYLVERRDGQPPDSDSFVGSLVFTPTPGAAVQLTGSYLPYYKPLSGKVKRGDSLKTTIIREMREELGPIIDDTEKDLLRQIGREYLPPQEKTTKKRPKLPPPDQVRAVGEACEANLKWNTTGATRAEKITWHWIPESASHISSRIESASDQLTLKSIAEELANQDTIKTIPSNSYPGLESVYTTIIYQVKLESWGEIYRIAGPQPIPRGETKIRKFYPSPPNCFITYDCTEAERDRSGSSCPVLLEQGSPAQPKGATGQAATKLKLPPPAAKPKPEKKKDKSAPKPKPERKKDNPTPKPKPKSKSKKAKN